MNIDELVHDYAKEMDMDFDDCIKFLSQRNSLQVGCEIIGINVLDHYDEQKHLVKRQDMEHIVDELDLYIKSHGFEPPKKWESGIDEYMPNMREPEKEPEKYERNPLTGHKPRMTVLKDLDRRWYLHDIDAFEHMWDQGLSLDDISKALKRDYDEVALLAIDRARHGHIEYRPNGIWGNRRPSA